MYSLTRIAAARMPHDSALNDTASGSKICSIELRARSKPIIRISIATISPAMYSARPWPNGCSVSFRLPESRKPASVITEDSASDRLLNASAVMAMEPVTAPANAFAPNSSALSAMPTAPQSTP